MKNQIVITAAGLLLCLQGLAQTPPKYTVTTIAGNNTAGYAGDSGPATAAQLDGPSSVWMDSKGNFYIADQFNHEIRMFGIGGNISTIAGTYAAAGLSGDGAAATAAHLNDPSDVIVDSKGNIYIADTTNNVVRMISPSGTISTFAGSGTAGFGGDGGSATSQGALLSKPAGLAVDSAGNLYIADSRNNRVRLITGGNISTFAGSANPGFAGDGGSATLARLTTPVGLALDSTGALYIADASTHSIRKVASGVITTVAGNATAGAGFSGDAGQAVNATLRSPRGVAVDACGNLFIADTLNNRVRMVTTSGTIWTIAGSGNPGNPGFSGDGGPATSAQFSAPSGVTVDSKGKVYVADTNNYVIRMLTPDSAPTCGGAAPAIKANGVISASDFGAFPSVAQGSWIEIYGTNLSNTTRSWTTADFSGTKAPISLDRTAVTIGGQSAFVDYVSPVQVNVQVPYSVGTGKQNITVSSASGTSAAYPVNVGLAQPGLYAPALFNIGGKQYVAATALDGTTFIAPPGSIPGRTTRQAKPGETIILYGIGFGSVSPGIPAGQIVQQSNTVSLPLSVFFGNAQATLQYSGLAGNFIGLYEFYAVVPNIADSDAVPLTFTLNGVNGAQTLYTAIKK